ncbi:MAG: DUF2999 family protein [Oligoflexales bacterium]|nr:DUF2999 family protein [Oligoflexales bacterium]
MDLQTIFKELNLTEAQVTELTETVKVNPMAALGLVQKYNINPEVIQKLIGFLMANPEALQGVAEKIGMSKEMVDQVQNQMGQGNRDPEKS